MSDTYEPPKVWEWKQNSNQAFANINRPTAGAQQEKELPIGKHPLQLYSLGTPNGVKVTIMLEELLAKGHSGAEYDAWLNQYRRWLAIRQWFRRGQPQLKDSSTRRPQRGDTPKSLRVGFDSPLPRGQVWGVHPKGSCGKNRMPELVILADGRNTDVGWWFWSLLRLRTSKDRIRD